MWWTCSSVAAANRQKATARWLAVFLLLAVLTIALCPAIVGSSSGAAFATATSTPPITTYDGAVKHSAAAFVVDSRVDFNAGPEVRVIGSSSRFTTVFVAAETGGDFVGPLTKAEYDGLQNHSIRTSSTTSLARLSTGSILWSSITDRRRQSSSRCTEGFRASSQTAVGSQSLAPLEASR
jgi:hypothetical protein